jgi:hypothetical protein
MPTRFSQFWSRQIVAKSAKVPFLGVSEGIDADGKAFLNSNSFWDVAFLFSFLHHRNCQFFHQV